MTTPTPRPTLSPEAAEALRWIAAGRPSAGAPPLTWNDSAWAKAINELIRAGLATLDTGSRKCDLTDAGREEAARLEEEAARRGGEQAPPPAPPPAAEPAPTIGGAIVGFIAQILMVPEGRKVAAGLIDSALDHLNRNREESRRVAEEIAAEKPAPAPATTERRAPKKGRRRRG